MVIERLKPEEYPMLCQIDDGYTPEPGTSIAIVAKDDEEFIGRIFLVAPVHVEGPFLMPDYRKGTLAKRLMQRAEEEAQKAGIKRLLAYGSTPEIEDYLGRLGFQKMELTVWSKELTCLQQ